MDFNEINKQLKKLSKTQSISDARTLISLLVNPLGISDSKSEELLIHPSVQREISRFCKAPGFRNQAAAYVIPHGMKEPVDLKLFCLNKTTKANLSWLVALTPNFEDNPENNPNANIGIDFVLNKEADRLFVILSKNLKLRVLELHESLSHTQREIFQNWENISNKLESGSDNYKQQLQEHLWKSFDFEPTNRKFYQELVTQFDHLVSHLKQELTEDQAKMFAVRFIGRTLFLWFLRKKEFINPDNNYFEIDGKSDQTTYYRTKLEPLFFEVLNTEIKSRTYDDKITPFLNGGLFEPIETDFYKDKKLTFPDGFFTQFYATLNHYNFTVDEGTSEYEHVAVDPEMLGRVFENLLASINEETGKQARKAKGAFYTPREIVDYMCQQSLVEYLKTKLPETPNRDRRIVELVTMSEPEFREQDHNKRRDWKKDLGKEDIVKALDEIRVLDPAVGSGAFPMGMLTLLVKVYSRIDTTREKDLSKLKQEILSQSLYGVDIDQMAIQISRLRAWLSMLVDMESLKKVEPLPNLDFKFVCANTLIPLDEGQNSLFDSDIDLKKKLIELRDQYYQATRKVEKNKIRKEYLKKIQTGNLFASEREKQLKDYNPFDPLNSSSFYDSSLMHGVEAFDVAIANPPYVSINQLAQRKDALINYLKTDNASLSNYFGVNLHSIPSDRKKYPPKPNLYAFFFVRANRLVKNNGHISFIVPKGLLTAKDLDTVRYFFLLSHKIQQIVLFTDKVFVHNETSAGSIATSSLLILLRKTKKIKDEKIYVFKTPLDRLGSSLPTTIQSDDLMENIKNWNLISFSEISLSILNKYNQSPSLERYYQHNSENKTSRHNFYFDVGFILDKANESETSDHNHKEHYRLFEFNGINKYHLETSGFYPKDKKFIKLTKNSQGYVVLDQKFKIIWSVKNPKAFAFSSEEIIFPMGKAAIIASNDKDEIVFLTAVLNSKISWFILKELLKHEGEKDLLIPISAIKIYIKIPICTNAVKNKIIKKCSEIIDELNENPGTDITERDREIDELVMDLYELTEEEKEIIRKS